MSEDDWSHELSIQPWSGLLTKKEQLARHWQALELSSDLAELWRRMYRPNAVKVRPERILKVLNKAGIRPTLIGLHGLGGWRSEPRATGDVDVLVRVRQFGRALAALLREYPRLKVHESGRATQLVDESINLNVIDLFKPNQEILRVIVRNTVSAGPSHVIPGLEMAVVAKFTNRRSNDRKLADRYLDAADCMDVVLHTRNVIDMKKLARLAHELFSDRGAGIKGFVADTLAERPIKI